MVQGVQGVPCTKMGHQEHKASLVQKWVIRSTRHPLYKNWLPGVQGVPCTKIGYQEYKAYLVQNMKIYMSYTHILLASHGTPGACAAEVAAFNLCHPDTTLHHLMVVPDFWKGMLGDDWLNNAVTQIRYGKYLEGELEKEIQENVNRVSAEAKARNLAYNYEFMLGKPAECLLKVADSSHFDLVVMGSPRPKNKEGLKSRMHCETLLCSLSIPLLIIPYPHDV